MCSCCASLPHPTYVLCILMPCVLFVLCMLKNYKDICLIAMFMCALQNSNPGGPWGPPDQPGGDHTDGKRNPCNSPAVLRGPPKRTSVPMPVLFVSGTGRWEVRAL